jgi:hypothetical protein
LLFLGCRWRVRPRPRQALATLQLFGNSSCWARRHLCLHTPCLYTVGSHSPTLRCVPLVVQASPSLPFTSPLTIRQTCVATLGWQHFNLVWQHSIFRGNTSFPFGNTTPPTVPHVAFGWTRYVCQTSREAGDQPTSGWSPVLISYGSMMAPASGWSTPVCDRWLPESWAGFPQTYFWLVQAPDVLSRRHKKIERIVYIGANDRIIAKSTTKFTHQPPLPARFRHRWWPGPQPKWPSQWRRHR